MKATETAVRPCPMIVSCYIDLGTAPLSSENGRFPFFQLHFAMTLLVWEKLSGRHSISVNGACSFVGMPGQYPKEHSQYFMKKTPLHKSHCPFFLPRLVLSFYLITAQLLLLQTSFNLFLVSSAGSWPDCSHPPFPCYCRVSSGVSRPCVWAQIPAVWMGELCRLDVSCVRHWISYKLQW